MKNYAITSTNGGKTSYVNNFLNGGKKKRTQTQPQFLQPNTFDNTNWQTIIGTKKKKLKSLLLLMILLERIVFLKGH